MEPKSIEKIFQIDTHIGAATSGLVADARVLIDRARVESQINRLVYDEPIGRSPGQKDLRLQAAVHSVWRCEALRHGPSHHRSRGGQHPPV